MTTPENNSLSPDSSQENQVDRIEITITEHHRSQFKRLDHLLADELPQYSRNFLKNLFESEMIEGIAPRKDKSEGDTCDNEDDVFTKLSLSKMPPAMTIIRIEIPPPIPAKAQPEKIPLDILYEDKDIIFINKPAGMVTHPAPGHYSGTLVNALLGHCQDLSGIGNELRPGIVHRLDMGTTGVMVAAKGQKAHEKLVIDFSKHNIERKYWALVPLTREIPPAGTLNGPIGRNSKNRLKMAITNSGRRACTHYKIIKSNGKLALFELTLETGRTHQIRVHLASLLQQPILNDYLYGNPKQQRDRLGPPFEKILGEYPHPLLHAKVLGLTHPISGQSLRFEVSPPKIFQEIVDLL